MSNDAGINDQMRRAPPFTWNGARNGAIRIMPLVPTVVMYGVAFGVLAAAAGLSMPEAVLFSGLVNAGAAQMASLQAWSNPVPILAVVLTTVGMNARYLLLGATLRPWLAGLPSRQVYASLFVMGDGNWALAHREHALGRDDAAFIAGSGAVLWVAWVSATAVGHAFGNVIVQPERFGIDFMLAAFFASMAVSFFRHARDLLPLAAGAVSAIAFERLVPGPWYLLVGAITGSVFAALRYHAAR